MDILRLRRDQFPVTERYVYLNHAAVAPVSVAVRRAMDDTVAGAAHHGIARIEAWQQLYSDARQSAARLVGTRPAQIAFLKNTTDGLITTALGMDWRAGDNVVLARGEFPANAYPWLNLARHGVSIRWVEATGHRLCVDDFATAIDSRTRLLSLSSVGFFSGFRCDLAAFGQLCRERGVLFVVDGIQSVGALRVEFDQLGIDCLAADGHKWLMGPEGCAMFAVSARALDQLHVAGLGWASVHSSHDFFSYDLELHGDARRFETGTQNTAGIAGLHAAMELLLNFGPEQVEARVLSLAARLADGLLQRGYEIIGSRLPGETSGIVTFRSSRASSQAVAAALTEAGVQFTERAATVRLSPHMYNTEDEIDAALASLSAVS